MSEPTQTYHGSCHCGAVTFTFDAIPVSEAVECNCSHCAIKGVLLTFIPREQLRIAQGEDALTEYRFNTKKIGHMFCKHCGVEPFGMATNQDGTLGAAINVRCVPEVDLAKITRIPYNGKDI